MKKIAALMFSLILLCGLFIMPASAAANYCEDFQSAINMLRWRIENNEVKEGEDFPTDAILDYTLSKFNEKDYATETNEQGFAIKIEIPASQFEGKANELFAKFSTDDLHSHDSYDEAKNAYVFNGAGGMGDSSRYCVYGYTQTHKCIVYSAFIQGEEALNAAPAGKTEGKDYIRYDGKFYMVEHWLKTVVEKGSEVKFHSWQRISASEVPTTDLTRSEKTLEEPVLNKSASTPSAISSETSSNTESESNITSSEAVSETSSAVEEVYETVAQTEEVTVEAPQATFPEGTVVAIVPVTEGASFDTATAAMEKQANKFVAFDITATKDNVKVQPDGTVKATFAIPEGYDLSKVCVLYVDDNGKTEILPSVVDKESGKVVATLSHFSLYVVAEMKEAVNVSADNTGAGIPAIVWVLIFVAIILAVGGGVAAWYFLYFKKKGANTAE